MTHIALYRRYRPEKFDDVIGQDAVINTLKGQVMNGRINHAYLFCGPRGIGKTSAARILARTINCEHPVNGSFCGKCNVCKTLDTPNNFDIIEIDAASNNGIDNIRDLRENVKFMPASGKYRVYIIDEVHMLSISAFNALLKTLEEPPAHIVFIMATTEPGKLPATVLSRCQRFDFNRFKATDTVKLLHKVAKEADIKIEDKAVESIAKASEGGARDALSLLDQCNAFTEGEIKQEHVSAILGSANNLMYFALAESIIMQDMARALGGFNKMLDDGCNTLSVARDLMTHFRDLFIAKHVKDAAETLAVDDVAASRLISQSSKAPEGVLIRCIDLFSTLESDLRYAAHPRVFVELAIAKACRAERGTSYDALLERIERLESAVASGNVSPKATADETASPEKKTDFIAAEQQSFPQFAEPSADYYDGTAADFDEVNSKETEKEYFPYTDKKEETKEKQLQMQAVADKKEKPAPTEAKSKKAKKSKAETKQDADAKTLWQKTIDLLKKQKKMSVVTAMRKAVPKSADDEVLTVMYDANLAGLDRLKDKSNIRMINEALSSVADKHMVFEVEHRILDEAEMGFLEDLGKFPKDLIHKN